MKRMERFYSGITLICLLCCAALIVEMVGRTGADRAAVQTHTPPGQLAGQVPEPVPETDPTAAHTGSVVLDENALTAQLKKLLPQQLRVTGLQLSLGKGGMITLGGRAERNGLLDWLEAKGADLGGTMSPLRVLLPEQIDFSLTLRAGQDAAAGTVTLQPVSARVAGQEFALPDLPEEVTAAIGDGVNQVLAANGWDSGSLEFLEGGIRLQ